MAAAPSFVPLRGLVIRVARYAEYRAASASEHAWAACLFDQLTDALREAADDPAVRASLAAADRRVAVSQKVRP